MMLSKSTEDRLKDIIKMAIKLEWVISQDHSFPYPTMRLSEVEKCMIALVDDSELERMRNWTKDIPDNKIVEEKNSKC
jgi:hypothetical protein